MTPVQIGIWQFPPEQPSLSHQELHLWRFRLDLSAEQIAALRRFLSADEIARAEKLRVAEKNKQLVVARGRLREILAGYLHSSPEKLQFEYGQHGKPRLLHSDKGIRFNLAHSGNWALLGVAQTSAIGVDLEQIDPALDFMKLATRFFSEQEQNRLSRVSVPRQSRFFYRLWTAKESRLKELGTGFSAPLPSATPPAFTRFLPIAKSYLGAVSCPKPICTIKKFHLPETR